MLFQKTPNSKNVFGLPAKPFGLGEATTPRKGESLADKNQSLDKTQSLYKREEAVVVRETRVADREYMVGQREYKVAQRQQKLLRIDDTLDYQQDILNQKRQQGKLRQAERQKAILHQQKQLKARQLQMDDQQRAIKLRQQKAAAKQLEIADQQRMLKVRQDLLKKIQGNPVRSVPQKVEDCASEGELGALRALMKQVDQKVSAKAKQYLGSFNSTYTGYYSSNYFHVGPRYQLLSFTRNIVDFFAQEDSPWKKSMRVIQDKKLSAPVKKESVPVVQAPLTIPVKKEMNIPFQPSVAQQAKKPSIPASNGGLGIFGFPVSKQDLSSISHSPTVLFSPPGISSLSQSSRNSQQDQFYEQDEESWSYLGY